jgi:hypothetical protein
MRQRVATRWRANTHTKHGRGLRAGWVCARFARARALTCGSFSFATFSSILDSSSRTSRSLSLIFELFAQNVWWTWPPLHAEQTNATCFGRTPFSAAWMNGTNCARARSFHASTRCFETMASVAALSSPCVVMLSCCRRSRARRLRPAMNFGLTPGRSHAELLPVLHLTVSPRVRPLRVSGAAFLRLCPKTIRRQFGNNSPNNSPAYSSIRRVA